MSHIYMYVIYKLIYSVRIGSTVKSGTQLLFTGAQLCRRVVDCREFHYRRRHLAEYGAVAAYGGHYRMTCANSLS